MVLHTEDTRGDRRWWSVPEGVTPAGVFRSDNFCVLFTTHSQGKVDRRGPEH